MIEGNNMVGGFIETETSIKVLLSHVFWKRFLLS